VLSKQGEVEMHFNLTDEQLKTILECLGQFHMVKYMKGEDNSDIEAIIEVIATDLTRNGKRWIFESVFQEYLHKDKEK
jgi:hypothetical protein